MQLSGGGHLAAALQMGSSGIPEQDWKSEQVRPDSAAGLESPGRRQKGDRGQPRLFLRMEGHVEAD